MSKLKKLNKTKSRLKKFKRAVKQAIIEVRRGACTLRDLDYSKPFNVYVAKTLLRENIAFIQQLDQNDPSQLKIMLNALAANTRAILHIKNPNDKLIGAYINARLVQTANGQPISVVNSFDNKPLIGYNYITQDNETVSFLDEKLCIPYTMMANAQVAVKIADAGALANKLDIALKHFTAQLFVDTISSIITNSIRQELYNIMKVEGLTYFDLTANYGKLADMIIANANAAFADYGIVVNTFVINEIVNLNDAHNNIENQYYAIAFEKCWKTYENEMQAVSLDSYAKKAEILDKYPNFKETLTEEEKDLALGRYLKKNGRCMKKFKYINKKGKLTHEFSPIKKALPLFRRPRRAQRPVYGPEFAPFGFKDTRKLGFLKKFIFFLLVFSGVSIYLISSVSQSLGFGLLAATAVIFGTILAFKSASIMGAKGRPQEEFDAAYAEYLNDVDFKRFAIKGTDGRPHADFDNIYAAYLNDLADEKTDAKAETEAAADKE